MFNKLFGWIIRPIIKKEIAKVMKDLIQPIADFIKTIMQIENGSKFLVTIAGIGGIIWLKYKAIGDPTTTITIACLIVAYYFADIYYKSKIKNGEPK